jgi:hypothetical protein
VNFTSQSENLATEGLYYILSKSPEAREGLIRFLKSIDPRFNDELSFKTQAYDEDQAIPDLVGVDEDNHQICIIESKFWAGLTQNQPITYLKRLEPNKASILLFLVPSKRIESLWSELKIRCDDAQILLTDEERIHPLIKAKLNENNYIAVTNWNSIFNLLETEIEAVGDYSIKGDLNQLRGLCNLIEQSAFLPLDSSEISPMIAKRNMQFSELIDEVVQTGKAREEYNVDKQKSACSGYWYGRYFKIDNYYFLLKVDNQKWYELRNTPLWLGVYGKSGLYSIADRPKVRKALHKLESNENNRLFLDYKDLPIVPIKLELSSEKEKVIESIMKQIKEIYQLLNENYDTI